MFAYGTAKRLSLPVTPEHMLRDLLGEILSPEREAAMRERGRLELADGCLIVERPLEARAVAFDETKPETHRIRFARVRRMAGMLMRV